MKCPHCNGEIRVSLSRGKAKKSRKKKDPTEPMSIDEFVEGCRKSTRPALQIIGEFADQLREMYGWEGHKTRGEWNNLFLRKNIRAANLLVPSWSRNGGREKFGKAVELIEEDTRDGSWRWSHLETLIKYMNKV